MLGGRCPGTLFLYKEESQHTCQAEPQSHNFLWGAGLSCFVKIPHHTSWMGQMSLLTFMNPLQM